MHKILQIIWITWASSIWLLNQKSTLDFNHLFKSSINYIPVSGKNKGKMTELFYYKNELVNHLTNVASLEGGNLIKKTIVGTLWDDIGWDGIANEGGVKLKFGKKPERLIHRIIEMCTQKNDIVLDYHLGSGTTAAVAHKMGRRYIGLEQMDYGKNDSIARLKNYFPPYRRLYPVYENQRQIGRAK